jgi:gamma-glutamylcyclotransferase (GGCT)/AIG2-like uncharacterized protein YtfP
MVNKTKIYGAYGSNMNIQQMKQRCPRGKIIGKGMLQDYKLTFRGKYRGVANIQPCKGRSVPIVLWEITDSCEKSLDLFEGYPNLYVKEQVEVMVDGKPITAMVYIMESRYTNMSSLPTDYYFDTIVKGCMDNNIDLETLKTAHSECLSETRQQNCAFA